MTEPPGNVSAVISPDHYNVGLNNGHLFSHSSGGWKPQIKEPGWSRDHM